MVAQSPPLVLLTQGRAALTARDATAAVGAYAALLVAAPTHTEALTSRDRTVADRISAKLAAST